MGLQWGWPKDKIGSNEGIIQKCFNLCPHPFERVVANISSQDENTEQDLQIKAPCYCRPINLKMTKER